MALALKDRVKETTIVVGTGTATLLGSSIGFQPFSVVGNGNTTYYCISDQFGSNWEVGIGTYSTSGNTLARTTVLASSNGGALVVFTAGIKDVFVTYPAEKGVWLDASGNAIGLGTPAAFVGTNITGTASGLTAGNVTTNANLSGAVSSIGNSTSLGSFTSAQLALAISDETGTGKAVFATNPTLTSPTYAGTLTGSTDILNIGSGQVYKDASGNVGIGTSSPSTTLHVKGGGNPILKLETSSNVTTGGYNYLTFWDSSNLQTGFIGYGGVANLLNINNNLTNGSIVFNTGASYLERMRIDSSGNLLVGTTSSAGAWKLQTSTDAYINGITVGRGAGDIVNNTVLGKNTGSFLTTGVYNTCIGYGAGGGNCSSLQGGTYIGAAMLASSATANYEIAIGFNLVGKGSATFYAGTNGGGSYNGANTTTWATTSDQRLKKNIVDNKQGLALINQIQVRNFEYRLPEEVTELPKHSVIDVKGIQLGVIAQEIQQVLPECVKEESTGVLSVQTDNLIWYLVNSIQEQQTLIEALTARLTKAGL